MSDPGDTILETVTLKTVHNKEMQIHKQYYILRHGSYPLSDDVPGLHLALPTANEKRSIL